MARIGGELRWRRLLPAATAGMVTGLLEIVLTLSFAALIYSGPLSGFVAQGIGLALLGVVLSVILMTLFTSLPGAVGGNQDAATAVLAIIAATVAQNMPANSHPQEIFLTVVVAIALTTVITGLFYWALGYFQSGNLVRFLPYPVVGGFLAGTGWLLATGGLGMMTEMPAAFSEITELVQPDVLWRWLPGFIFAVFLLVAFRRSHHFLLLPGMVLGGIGLFYLAAWLTGRDVVALLAAGWLLGPFPEGSLLPPLPYTGLEQVNWPALSGQLLNVVTVCIISVLALLLNASGLEIATRREVDLNRELQAAGAGNVVAGLVGGMISYQQLSLSVMNIKMGNNSRLAGLFAAVVCGLALLLGASVLSLFPKMILGGLILYLGLSFLVEWVVETWAKVPRLDYLVIVLILVVTAVVGFLEAVAIGLLVAVIFFVINYSRVDVVRQEMSGQECQSRLTRDFAEQHFLDVAGEQIYILQLQGYIFFGTADSLLNRVRQRMGDADLPPVRFVVLDFHRVTKIDSTTIVSFQKMWQLAQARQIMLVLTDLSPGILAQFGQSDLMVSQLDGIYLFADLDHGLEWCEDQLLAAMDEMVDGKRPLWEANPTLSDPQQQARLLHYFERQEMVAGDTLIQQGDRPDALYFIETGQVTAQMEQDGREPVRFQTMRSGHIVGEIGFYLGQERTAAVVVDKPGVVYRLSVDALHRMEQEAPDIAAAFHQIMSHLMAERVTHLVRQVDAFQQYKR